MPLARPAVPNGTRILWFGNVRRLHFWRTVEALVIAAVFSGLLVRASMHRISRFYGGATLPSEMVDQGTLSQEPNPVAAVLASSQKAIVRLERLQSIQRSQADIIAEDTVIRYNKHSANRLPGKTTASLSRARGPIQLRFGRDTDTVAADTVVRYGTRFATPRLEGQNKP